MKKYIPLLTIASLMGATSYAADFIAENDGDWTDVTVWQDGELPTETDSVIYYNGITVDVTTNVTVASSPWKDHHATLNITGEDAYLTYTGTFTMYGNTRMEFNVSDGATLDVNQFDWGTGGYSNFNITDGGILNTTFGQFSGSTQGSKILVDNSTAIMKSQWNVGATANGQKIDIIFNGANTVVKSGRGDTERETLRVNSTGTSTATVTFSNGAYANLYDLYIGSFYSNSGANKVIFYGEGTKVLAQSINIGKAGETVESFMQFGGFDTDGNFVAACAGSLKNAWEVKVETNGKIKFLLGAENAFQADELTNDHKANAIFAGQFVKSMQEGAIEADFSNVAGLVEGSSYWFALLSSTQSIEGTNNTFNDVAWDWDKILKITDSGNMKFNEYQIYNNTLFVNMTVVPEPSTYAMIFGAIALAFVAYRRRK